MPSDADLYEQLASRLRSRCHAQGVLWHLLGRGHQRRISTLAAALCAPDPPPDDPRRQQQRVGAIITLLNRKLIEHGARIAPGKARRTYKLYFTP